jgi:hypothetical protein
MLKRLKRFAWASLLTICCASVSLAQQPKQLVDVLLVFAVDVSGSISDDSYALQVQGYAAAFKDEKVLKAIANGPHGRIGVAMVHWSGEYSQVIAVPWMLVSDRKSAEAFADEVIAIPRSFAGQTAIGRAINFSVEVLERAPWSGLRRVIDISGDGINNEGIDPIFARDLAVKRGIVINGLPIMRPDERNLDQYYEANVIGGPGAFMIVAKNYAAFKNAIIRKILIEIS